MTNVFLDGNGSDVLRPEGWRVLDPINPLPSGWWRVIGCWDGWWTDAPINEPLTWQGDYA